MKKLIITIMISICCTTVCYGQTSRIDRIGGLVGSIAVKAPVKVATTTNITLSGAQTIDGVTLTADEYPRQRVLVRNQTDSAENGIYDVNSGAWSRSPDFDGARDVVNGTMITVLEGSASYRREWYVDASDPIDIGTTDIYFDALTLESSYVAVGEYYYPDYTETDQGISGDGSSINDLITLVGLSRQVTFFFKHNSGGPTTSYSFLTSETIPDNITIEMENGAVFAGSTATITFTNPDQLKIGSRQWVFDDVAVAFSEGGTVSPLNFGENTTPGTTDMTAIFEKATASFPAPWDDSTSSQLNGKLLIPIGRYAINDWHPDSAVAYEGESPDGTVLEGTSSHIINITEDLNNKGWSHSMVSNLTFLPLSTKCSIYTDDASVSTINWIKIAKVNFHNVRFAAPAVYSIRGNFNSCTFNDCYFGSNGVDQVESHIYLGAVGSSSHANNFNDCAFNYADKAIVEFGTEGVAHQDNNFNGCIFERCDGVAFWLVNQYNTKILNSYFEGFNSEDRSGLNSIFYFEADNYGVTIIEHNHFGGNTALVANLENICYIAAGQPKIQVNKNTFVNVYNGFEAVNLRSQDSFWFLGNYHAAGAFTFGADESYRYYNDVNILPYTDQIIKAGDSTLIANQLYGGSVFNNLGQSAGSGAILVYTLPGAAEGMSFKVILGEAPGTRLAIKPSASNRFNFDGVNMGLAEEIHSSSNAVGDCIEFQAFQVGSSPDVWRWLATTINGTWVQETP